MTDNSNSHDEGGVRLLAQTADDLEVLSALLQDAIVPGEDMAHDRGGRRFVMVVNRFCWDLPPVEGVTSEDGGPVYERRLCGVQIHNVTAVRQTGMPADRRAALLNLLAIKLDRAEAGGARVEWLFSGGAALQFDIDSLSVIAEDIDAGQPTPNRPTHDVDG